MAVIGKAMFNPARSVNPSMCRNSKRENREISQLSDNQSERTGKDCTHNPVMISCEKSDNFIVSTKSLNKTNGNIQGRKPHIVAEAMEKRKLTKGNANQQTISRTPSRTYDMQNALTRIRRAVQKGKDVKLTALLHHVNVDSLRKAYFMLKRSAAAGVDGITWEQYGENLEANLKGLHARVHRGAYRAKPSRRVFIPKPDGRQRPLGIASLEDKLLQKVVVEVLNAIYEEDFLGFSYGFRPGRNQHQALDALCVSFQQKKINWILDADIRGYFDSINHKWLMKFIEHRVSDKRVLRLIKKWLKAGVLEEGKKIATDEGSPQGATISPLLSNIYLHYVLDLWANQWRKRHAKGDVIIVRYADDFVIGFQCQDDAERFVEDLRARLEKFSLELHKDKTRLIRFGKYARRDCKRLDGRRKPETFDFLGFTHICGQGRIGHFWVMRKSIRKRLTAKLHDLKTKLHKVMHLPVGVQGKWLRRVVNGYYAYHAIHGNLKAVTTFRIALIKLWRSALSRRSQKGYVTWEKMTRICEFWLPHPRILHPWPEVRFRRQHLR